MKKKAGLPIKKELKEDKFPSHDDIYAAMMKAEDILQRAQIPFVVLGDVAKQMYNNENLHVHKVVFGVLQQHAVEECTSLLPTIAPDLENLKDGWNVRTPNVTVYIKILPKKYPAIMNPDVIFYMYDAWRIPNPFAQYWKGDHLDI